jgi:FOG: PKD repeat
MRQYIIILTLICIVAISGAAYASATDSTALSTTVLPSYNGIYFNVANDAGLRFNEYSNDSIYNNTYYVAKGGGGLNPIQIATTPTNTVGNIVNTTNQSGTFDIVFSGGIHHADDVILLVAVKGPISDGFGLTLTANGYTWTPQIFGATSNTGTDPVNYTYNPTTLSETFSKSDFMYGPQSWKPANSANYSIYNGENVQDTDNNSFYLMFVDLNAGALAQSNYGTLVNNGSVEVHYNFTNLNSVAAFNVYGWFASCNWGMGIPMTNNIAQSSYLVQGTSPIADFTANTTSGENTAAVQFNDTSNNTPTSWLWDFGDGTTSTDENATHTYSEPGNYTVKLTASNSAGSDEKVKTSYINIADTIAPTVNASVLGGAYNKVQNVSLKSDESKCTIYYTTDGSDPTNDSSVYNEPITIKNSTTLKYFAVDAAGNVGSISTQVYTIDTTAPTVSANLTSGTYNSIQTVSLTATDDSNTTIYYTIDGSDPTMDSLVYKEPITLGNSTTLKYFAVDAANNTSPIYNETYIIDTTAPIVVTNVVSNIYNCVVSLVSNELSTIYYTLDGSDPTNSSLVYNGPLSINVTTLLKYVAVDVAGNWAAIQEQLYTIDKIAPTASASVNAGTYNVSKTVTLKMSENGAIYYTTNGSTPTSSSKKYAGAITISSTTTLKFLAIDNAGNPSSVYSVQYVIDKAAPKVSAICPTSSATGVLRTKTVSIRLSENVLKGVNWSNVYIKNLKTGQKCKATIWISGNHIYISTNSKKAASTWYQVYIPASAIKDSAGNNLAAAYTFKFKTGKN